MSPESCSAATDVCRAVESEARPVAGIDPERTFRFEVMNGRKALESGRPCARQARAPGRHPPACSRDPDYRFVAHANRTGGVALSGPMPGNAMDHPVEFAELVDVDVDESVRVGRAHGDEPARPASLPAKTGRMTECLPSATGFVVRRRGGSAVTVLPTPLRVCVVDLSG